MEEENQLTALASGTVLNNRFTITDVIGSGGLSIIYRARDRYTGQYVALKECAPYGMVLRKDDGSLRLLEAEYQEAMESALDGMNKEIEVVRTMTDRGVSGVPQYVDSFSANYTVYLAMTEVVGRDLHYWASSYRQAGQHFPEKMVISILMGTLGILEQMHQLEYYHCDVKPSNIIIDDSGRIFLIDFGAVRTEEDQHFSVQVSPGYTPVEMYPSHRAHIGPWSDVYMLATLFYNILTGRVPEPANERAQKDRTPRLSTDPSLAGIYSPALLNSLDKAMAVEPSQRYTTAEIWMEDFTTRSRGPQLISGGARRAPVSRPVTSSAPLRKTKKGSPAEEKKAGWVRYAILAMGVIACLVYVYVL